VCGAWSRNQAFVLDNNIYVKNTADSSVRQVTTDGTATRQAGALLSWPPL
jgi:hypothetical protein